MGRSKRTPVEQRTILSLCDYSGTWSQPYKAAGYHVIRVDAKFGDDVRFWPSPRQHGKGGRLPNDFLDIQEYDIWGVLAAPPCTYFSGSGARWPRTNREISEGLSIVDACVRIIWAVKPEWWALENPVGKLTKWLGPYEMSFHPYEYAGWAEEPATEAYTKATCLWGQFRKPEKKPVTVDKNLQPIMRLGGKKESTKTKRSITPTGFAKAFFEANQ